MCQRGARDDAGCRIDGEVVVVDNHCTDDSAAVALSAGARVVAESRPGYGSALRAGFSAARCDIIIMADADFTYDLRKIPALIAPILRGEADLVLGNRLDAAHARRCPSSTATSARRSSPSWPHGRAVAAL